MLGEYLPEPPLLRPIQRFVEKVPALTEKEKASGPVNAGVHASQPAGTTAPTPEPAPKATSVPLKEAQPKTEFSEPSPETAETHETEIQADTQKVVNASFQKLLKVAAFLLKEEPMNPMTYRCRRIALWSKISSLPSATNGQTLIPPPAPQVVKPLLELRDNANWSALLASAEQKLSQFIFWFDLNRFSAESLASLGPSYQQAHQAVCQETSFLRHRFPGLEEFAFSDGTPFADPDTKRWLNSIEPGSGKATARSVTMTEPEGGNGEKGKMAKAIQSAQTLAKQNRLVEAVKSLQTELQSSFSRKEALLWRLALCQILIGSKRTDMALPHLELILKDIDAFQLATWDPALALKGLKVVWTGFSHHTNKEYKHNAETVLNRISELDPVAALNLVK
jgi:type VI secretion system protein VasJ